MPLLMFSAIGFLNRRKTLNFRRWYLILRGSDIKKTGIFGFIAERFIEEYSQP